MTTFLLIRHATADAVGKRLAGRTKDVHLNEDGRLQAAKLAQRLQQLPSKPFTAALLKEQWKRLLHWRSCYSWRSR
jgi:probable phosphoglycerate mutase